MRGKRVIVALMLALAAPGMAQDAPLDGPGFEAEVTGQTLTWAQGGVVFGTEQYLPGRRVRWAFAGDICRDGRWYAEGAAICFVYDGDQAAPQCWRFWREAGQLRARLAGAAPGRDLVAVARTDQPLHCAGPDLGV